MTEIEERLKGIEDFIASGGVSKMNAGVSTYNAKWLCELVRSQQSELARFREHFKKIDTLSYECRCIPAQLICREAKEALTAAPGEKGECKHVELDEIAPKVQRCLECGFVRTNP
jgi:hypothetical protein